jgi:two-component system nitrogen regulation sensor histidine kinase GlnL
MIGSSVRRVADLARPPRAPAADPGLLANLVPLPLVVLDGEDLFRFANPAAELFFQLSTASLAQQRLSDIVPRDSRVFAVIEQVRALDAPVSDHDITFDSPRLAREGVTVHGTPFADLPGGVLLVLQERSTAQKLDRQLNFRGAARGASAMAAMVAM